MDFDEELTYLKLIFCCLQSISPWKQVEGVPLPVELQSDLRRREPLTCLFVNVCVLINFHQYK